MCEFSLEELMILSNKSERRGPREREKEYNARVFLTQSKQEVSSQAEILGESCLSTKMTKEVTYPCKGTFR